MSDVSRCGRRDLRQCSERVVATVLLLGALGSDPTVRTDSTDHAGFRTAAPDGGTPNGHPRWVADVPDSVTDSQSAASGDDAMSAPGPVSCGEIRVFCRSILAAEMARPLRLASGGVRGRGPPFSA